MSVFYNKNNHENTKPYTLNEPKMSLVRLRVTIQRGLGDLLEEVNLVLWADLCKLPEIGGRIAI